MTHSTFNLRRFLRTILGFVILTVAWTSLCIAADEFTDRDKGFVSGLGYLLLFSASIYMGQEIKDLHQLGYLTFVSIATFLVASYVLAPLIGLTTNSWVLYAIVNSVIVSIVMVISLDKIVGIQFRYLTAIATCVCTLVGYYIYDKFQDDFYLDYDIRPIHTMFTVFQLMLVIPLAIGMNLKKTIAPSPDAMH